MSAATAGALYCAVVFAAGFVLGAIRVLWVAPAIGGTGAVLLELPAMLGVSWFIAGRLVARLRHPGRISDRATMGMVALGLLLACEVLLGTWGFGRSAADQLRAWMTPEGLLGLGGQVLFGLMPVILWPRAP